MLQIGTMGLKVKGCYTISFPLLTKQSEELKIQTNKLMKEATQMFISDLQLYYSHRLSTSKTTQIEKNFKYYKE